MAYSDIRDELKSVIAAVSGMGTVHAYDRYSRSWDKFLTLFKTAGNKINGAVVTRQSTAKQQVTTGETEKAHVFRMRFLYGLKDADASELVFQDLLDAVDAAVDAWEATLVITGRTTHPDFGPLRGACGLQIDTIEPRMFGSVLCHYAECRLCVQETM